MKTKKLLITKKYFFYSSPDEIVNFLSNNENYEFGLENLEGMLKILPDVNEVDIISSKNVLHP